MNFVEPIRDKNKLEDILSYLKVSNSRNHILFLLGLYSGLRISDIRLLQVKHVEKLDYIYLREKKTNKHKKITINKVLKKELALYIKDKEPHEYLISSNRKNGEPITRQQAYRIIKGVCEQFGIEHVGTHTLRKTFGYHFYQNTKDVAILQNIFNHTDPSVTLRYIGINQDSISVAYKNMKYF